jgi:CO/xanthine dehydrogenase FAD-binding subunit
MTLADVGRSKTIRERAPLLAEAALNVASNQVRHMGTLGGNICLENRCLYYNQTHTYQFSEPCFKRSGDRCYLLPKGKRCRAIFTADTVPALIALGARVNITAPEGARQLLLESLYTGNSLRPLGLSGSELVTEVTIPARGPLWSAAFVKFSLRGGMEFAVLTVAVVMDMEDDGHTSSGAHIIVGSISAGPVRARKAGEAMVGQHLSRDLFKEVAHMVANEVNPFPHHGYSVAYLNECLEVQCGRALDLAFKRVGRQ